MALYGSVSVLAASTVVIRAFRERTNFYAATVWLGRSNGCMLVLLNFGVFLTVLFGKVCQAIFFGSLRPIEVEHLYERSWYAVTETLLAMTIFRDEFDASFVVLFGTLLFLKVFHWLCADRVELMEQSPNINRLFHWRMISMLWTLCCADLFLVAFALEVLISDKQRMGIMIMFASEFMILTATLWSTCAKYFINYADMRSDEPWEGKSMWVAGVDLVTDFLKLVTYIGFFSLILTYYGLPLNIVRDVYVTGRSFFGRIRDLIRYRVATRNMDTRFPNATTEDLSRTDATCIICRDEMVARQAAGTQQDDDADVPEAPEAPEAPPARPSASGLNDTPKKLVCGHIFHFHCLRSWLERQQSCPTCRRTVFDTTPTDAAPARAATNAAQGDQQMAAGAQAPGTAAANAVLARFGQAPGPTQQPQAGTPPSQGSTTPSSSRMPMQQVVQSRSRVRRNQLQDILDEVLLGTTRDSDRLQASRRRPNRAERHGDVDSTGRWIPPTPESLQANSKSVRLDLPQSDSRPSSAAQGTPTITSTATSAKSATASQQTQADADDSVDPSDPRAAARAAALKRFASQNESRGNQGTSIRTPAQPGTTQQGAESPPKVAFHDLGEGKADPVPIIRDEDLRSLQESPDTAAAARKRLETQYAIAERAQQAMWKVQMDLSRALSALDASSPNKAATGSTRPLDESSESIIVAPDDDSDDDDDEMQRLDGAMAEAAAEMMRETKEQNHSMSPERNQDKGKQAAEGLNVASSAAPPE